MAAFAEHAYRYLRARPPSILWRLDKDDLDEITQLIVLHCVARNCERLRRYEPRGFSFFASYFRRLAVNRAKTWLTKVTKHPTEPEDTAPEPRDPHPSIDTILPNREAIAIVRRHIESLPDPEDRLLLMGRFFDERTNLELAALLPGRDNVWVGNRIRNLLQRLRRDLGNHENFKEFEPRSKPRPGGRRNDRRDER